MIPCFDRPTATVEKCPIIFSVADSSSSETGNSKDLVLQDRTDTNPRLTLLTHSAHLSAPTGFSGIFPGRVRCFSREPFHSANRLKTTREYQEMFGMWFRVRQIRKETRIGLTPAGWWAGSVIKDLQKAYICTLFLTSQQIARIQKQPHGFPRKSTFAVHGIPHSSYQDQEIMYMVFRTHHNYRDQRIVCMVLRTHHNYKDQEIVCVTESFSYRKSRLRWFPRSHGI